MGKLRMLDLFCGRWGWSKAFAARGWECVGIDLVAPPEVPDGCTFIKADIMDIAFIWGTFDDNAAPVQIDALSIFDGRNYQSLGDFDFICASSPCEQFSIHGMKHFHPNPKYPDLGIELFSHTRELCEASGVPYVMENVRAAQAFVGAAKHHCGPFYLWGNGAPAALPKGMRKGMSHFVPGIAQMSREQITAWRRANDPMWSNSKSPKRKAATALAATIPPELSNAVANYAERLIAMKDSA